MKGTMIEYLKEYGQIPLAEEGMNEVDSLILCQLSYLKFEGLVPEIKENAASVSLQQVAQLADEKLLFADERYEKSNRALFEGMVGSKRFGNMKLNCYVNIVEKEWETQFSAITFLLEDGTIYVAFRGTDETIVGWKEDFNMIHQYPIPGQSYAVKYLNMVADRIRQPLYVGGHSKGGNLAIYSAMKCKPDIQDKIIRVYNMDGPGFRREVLEECGYDKIADRVVKILPHSSFFGMLFEWDMRYKVVESNSFGLMQHDPFSWQVVEGRFVVAHQVYESLRLMDHTVTDWLLQLEKEQAKKFFDTLFNIVGATQADDLITLAANPKESLKRVRAAYKEVDDETKKMLKFTLQSLTKLAGDTLKENVKISINNLLKIK